LVFAVRDHGLPPRWLLMLEALVLAVEAPAEEGGGNALIDVVPGLMIWTIVTFAIVLFVLRRFAFGRIQGLIDERRDRIRQALDEADKAREEARQLRELTRQEREQAIAERDRALEEGRRQAQEQLRRAREEADADLQRRLEENRRALEAENRKLHDEIRRDVVELTLLASEKVTRKSLDEEDQRRLIDETIAELDVKRIASEN
jgi:F-type H+-transporting ATPase subunit b